MPIFVSLVKFTREGIMSLKDEGIARSDKVQKAVESLGGRLIAAYYCLGPYDVVAVVEFPTTKAAVKASVLNSALGAYQVTTMAAVTREEWKQLLGELWPRTRK